MREMVAEQTTAWEGGYARAAAVYIRQGLDACLIVILSVARQYRGAGGWVRGTVDMIAQAVSRKSRLWSRRCKGNCDCCKL